MDGGRRPHRGRGGRCHRRHQHGMSGAARHQRGIRVGADARSRPRRRPDRRDRRGGAGAGDPEDAARLGRPLPQCAGTGAPRRSFGRAADHGSWPHALPVLQGERRLGGGSRRQAGGFDPRGGQRRYHDLRGRPHGARAFRRGRRHDRPRRRRPAVVSGPGRALSGRRAARGRAAAVLAARRHRGAL